MGKEPKAQKTDQQQFWQMAVETHQESGLSVAAFCKQEGISEGTFYYWRKKLAEGVSPPPPPSTPTFIEVAVPRRDTAALELLLTSGNTLRIGPGADDKTLRDVLSVLQKAGLC